MKQTLNLRQQLSFSLRYCYSSKRATQNMTRNSPTIGLNLRALPLYEQSVSLHHLSRCLRSIVTATTVTWTASSKICCHVILTLYATKASSTTIRSRVSQPASAGKETDLVNSKRITASSACYQNSEPDSCAVWVSYRQTNCHCND